MTKVRRAGSSCVQAPVGTAGGAAAPACSCIPDELGRKAAVSCGCVSSPPGRALPTCQVLLEYCCPSPFPATDTEIVDMMHTTTLSMGSMELLDAVLAYLPPPTNGVVPVAGGASGRREMYMLGLVADKAVARLMQLPAPGPQASGRGWWAGWCQASLWADTQQLERWAGARRCCLLAASAVHAAGALMPTGVNGKHLKPVGFNCTCPAAYPSAGAGGGARIPSAAILAPCKLAVPGRCEAGIREEPGSMPTLGAGPGQVRWWDLNRRAGCLH